MTKDISPISGLVFDTDNRGEQVFVRMYDEKPELNTMKQAKFLIEVLKQREQVIDFLNEVEEQDWELDADDIRHVLNCDFDYVRKQQATKLVRLSEGFQ